MGAACDEPLAWPMLWPGSDERLEHVMERFEQKGS
jgi:hypothetical protein